MATRGRSAERFESAGVHHARTTVEAALYDNQDVAVVGAENSAGQAAMFLAECCRTRTVHLLVRRCLGKDMSDYLIGRVTQPRTFLYTKVSRSLIFTVHPDWKALH